MLTIDHRQGILWMLCVLEVNCKSLQCWYTFTYRVECFKHMFMSVKNNHLVYFTDMEFGISINLFAANPGIDNVRRVHFGQKHIIFRRWWFNGTDALYYE